LSESSNRNWAAQARYLRAAVMAGRGSPDALKDALALIKSPGASEATLSIAEKIQQIRANAHLLAMQPFRNPRRQAAQILEQLIDRRLATPADHLLAAQLYEAVGDVAKARTRYTAFLTLPGGDTAAMLVAAGRFLVRHGDLDGAAHVLDELQRKPQQAAAAKELRARMLHAQNQTEKAVELILETAETDGIDRSAVASVLEEFGRFDQAEAQLRKFVVTAPRPEATLTLAQYLIRRSRFADALNECEVAWSRCSPVAVAETCLTILAQMPADRSAFGRVEARVRAALEKSPDDTLLLTALAGVRNFQGQFDDAETLYRRVLEKDAGNATALNNLAWLLALKSGHTDEALKLVDRAVQAIGPNPNLLDTRAVAYLGLSQPAAAKMAVKELDQVIAESPSPTGYFHLAQAHLLAGQKREALQAWRKANEGAPLKPESLHPLERTAFDRLVGVLGSTN